MGGVKTYLADRVIINFNGVNLTGYADGEFCVVSPNAEAWTKTSGADGEKVRSRSNDFSHTVDINLLQSSKSNDYLSGVAEVDRLTGLGKGPLLITDLSGSTLHFWPEAWIQQNADSAFGKEAGERSWTFDTGDIAPGSNIVGGNN